MGVLGDIWASLVAWKLSNKKGRHLKKNFASRMEGV